MSRRKYLKTLTRRRDWLAKLLEAAPVRPDLSYIEAEYAALHWAIPILEAALAAEKGKL